MLSNNLFVFGDQNVQVPAHLNFGQYMLDRLRNHKDAIALENISTKDKLSYRDIAQYAVNLATALIKLGVKKGDVVAIGSEKRNEFITIIFGIMFTGATYTCHPLNSGIATFQHKLNLTRPKYFICSKSFLEEYGEMIKNCDFVAMVLTIDDNFDSVPSIKELMRKEAIDLELFEPVDVQGQADVVLILYSSGTTGLSKAVQLTHLNCILNSLPDNNQTLQVGYISGQWYHNYDTFMTYKFFVSGNKIVYGEEVNPESILRSVDEYHANILFLVPSNVCLLSKTTDLSKYNPDSLKIIYSRSSPLHKKTIDKVKEIFPSLECVLQGYGMSEAGEISSESRGHKGPKSGSVGKASPGITLKVSDTKTRKTVGPNEHGEICLKGPVLMKGYIGMDLSDYLDEEGFFKTGDLGYYDEDEYIYIVGRLKEIIVYGGGNVPPLEVETILQLHPGVQEAAVVGKSDPVFGELPTAFVVKQSGANVTETELINYVAKEVMPHMQLRGGVKFIEEIPRNPTGKILRQNLTDLLKEI